MEPARVPRWIAELPKSRSTDDAFFVDLSFDSRLLLTYRTERESCLDELIDGSWYPLFRADPSKHRWCIAQPLANETLLLVYPRTRGPLEPNAILVDSSGREGERWYLGDGIEHCQSDAAGNIWVGYFDEGVYGHQALGQQGLVKFDQGGQPQFQFQRDAGGFPAISDCYALNVTGQEEAWTCYYTDFPLVRIRNNKAELILDQAPAEGSGAMTLDRIGRNCALWSDYEKSSLAHIVDLETRAYRKVPLTTADGQTFPAWACAARGSRLVLALNSALYEFDLNSDL